MKRFTKTETKKRLEEARNKILAVAFRSHLHVSPADEAKLTKMAQELMKIVNKIK